MTVALGAAALGPLMPGFLEALERSGVPIVVFAATGDHLERLYANEPAATMLGYTLSELYATPVLDTLAPEHRELVSQLVTAYQGGQPLPPVMEILLCHRDGSTLPIEASSVRVERPEGDLYVNVMRPLALSRQAQLTLLESDRIALVGALSAGFAHEINNPLTSLLLNLRTVRKHVTTAAATRAVEDIALAADRIAGNVRALQTLATRSTPVDVDLAAVVASALRLAAPTLESVALVGKRLDPARVVGEEARIGQAVLAMLLFACSGFDAPSGVPRNRIDVQVGQREGSAVVEVADNGRDLTADEARRAFDPFFRSAARGAGVGVGLGVARAVATALAGTVTLSPRPGGGAVVTMTLSSTEPGTS